MNPSGKHVLFLALVLLGLAISRLDAAWYPSIVGWALALIAIAGWFVFAVRNQRSS